jgi:tetratricopeptide (TPR) repeat protein
VRYRLLETTRAYALEKLVQAGEFDAMARRHAGYYLELFADAEAEAETRPTDEWLADYGPRIDNVRAALDWAFSPGGDPSIGIALTAVSVSLWFQLSLLPECRRRVDRALSSLRAGPAPDPRHEMQLLAALAATLLFTANAVHEIRATWTRVLEIAQGLQDTRYRLRALGGLWVVSLNCGEFREMLTLAETAREVAGGGADPPSLLVNDRMMGEPLHYLGDQAAARRHLEHMLDHDVLSPYRSPTWGAQVNPQVSVRCTLARVLWLQGFPDQATRMAESAVAQARARDNIILLCFALTWAAYPVAALNGDLAAAGHATAILLAMSSEYGASLYHAWGRRYEAMLVVRKGDAGAGVPVLRASLGALHDRGLTLPYTPALCDLAEALRLAGQPAEALATIDEALARSERIEERWCIAELLRVKGSVLLLDGGPQATATAEDQFQQALGWARRQGTLSWELRSATSLARLWRDQGRSADATALLQPVSDRFTEGFATADLKSAKALLDDLS